MLLERTLYNDPDCVLALLPGPKRTVEIEPSYTSQPIWYDRSRRRNNATQKAWNYQPQIEVNAYQGHNALKSNTDICYMTADIPTGPALTVMAVVANTAATIASGEVDCIISSAASGATISGFAFLTSKSLTRSFQSEGTGASRTVYKNGSTSPVTLNQNEFAVGTLVATGVTAQTKVYINSYANERFSGRHLTLALLMFNKALGTDKLNYYHRLLSRRFNIEVALL